MDNECKYLTIENLLLVIFQFHKCTKYDRREDDE